LNGCEDATVIWTGEADGKKNEKEKNPKP